MPQFFAWLDQYTDWLETFLQTHAVLAPLLLLLVEEMGLPILIPGDAIIAYAGYGLSRHHTAKLWQAFVVALVAVLIGATVLFFASRRWGRTVIDKVGRFVFIRQQHINRAEQLFSRYGVWTVIFGRHVPGMRVPITIFAATSGMRYRTFMACTFISTVLWILFYLKLGKTFGTNLQSLFRHDTAVSLIVFGIVILLAAALHIYGRRKRKL